MTHRADPQGAGSTRRAGSASEAARKTIRQEASRLLWFLGFGALALLLDGPGPGARS